MKAGAKTRLSVMMFLQYAIWGAWAPVLTLHLMELPEFKASPNPALLISLVYMTMALASMVAPVAGQIADRYFSTERFLFVSHLVGGALIIWVYFLQSFWGVFSVMLLHTLLYAPTVGLTNSIALHHLPSGERDFGRVRLWGTVGWIVIAWVFAVWLGGADGLVGAMSPEARESLAGWREELPTAYKPRIGQTLLVAGGLSVVLAMFCLTLPHTPPAQRSENPFAFLGAVKLMKNRSFAVLIVVAFLVSTELQFYYVFTPQYFNQSGGPFTDKQIAEALVKQRGTQAAYDAAELARQWDEKKLVLWDQRTLSRDQINDLRKGLADALLNTVYAARAQRDAEDMVFIGDAKELGGNGDGRLSRPEHKRLQQLKSKDLDAVYEGAIRNLESTRTRLADAADEETRATLQERVQTLEKRLESLELFQLSELIEQRKQLAKESAEERAKLSAAIHARAVEQKYYEGQASGVAELAALAVVAAEAIPRLQKQRETVEIHDRIAIESTLSDLNRRLNRYDERRPNLAKLGTNATTAFNVFQIVQEAKGGLMLDEAWVGPVMTFGQIAEVLVLLLVPLSLRRLGFRFTIALGILAWCVRYLLFSLGYPPDLIIGSQALHGFGFAFFFVAAFIYADKVASADIRASAQSFIIFVTYGAGMLVSSLIAGPVVDLLDRNWHLVFLVPAVITGLCTVGFVIAFKDPPRPPETKPKDPLTEFIERAERRARARDERESGRAGGPQGA